MGAEVGVVGGGCGGGGGGGKEGGCGDGLDEAVLAVAADDVREVGDRLDRDALLAVVAPVLRRFGGRRRWLRR